jgi:hypothetical protein
VSHSQTISNLKEYIIAEGKTKRSMEILKADLKGCNLKSGIPQQTNFCDCGLYLCGYVHKFMENPRRFGKKLLAQEFDLETDWPDMDPDKMRAGVRDMLQQFAKEQTDHRKREKEARRLAKRGGAAPSPPKAEDEPPKPEKAPDPIPDPVPDVGPSSNVNLNVDDQLLVELKAATTDGGDNFQNRSSSAPPRSSSAPETSNVSSPDEMLLNGAKEQIISVVSPQNPRAIPKLSTKQHTIFSPRGSSPVVYSVDSSPEKSREAPKLPPYDGASGESLELQKPKRSRGSQIVDDFVTQLENQLGKG